MMDCINMNQLVLSISKLNLGDKIETILIDQGVLYLTDLSDLDEARLKKIPGIGYASARKILRTYQTYIDRLQPNETNRPVRKQEVVEQNYRPEVSMHSVLERSNLNPQDKMIINLVVHGYSQQQISASSGLSKRTLRHRLAMLKIEYQAKTVTQLVCNIFDDVLLLTE